MPFLSYYEIVRSYNAQYEFVLDDGTVYYRTDLFSFAQSVVDKQLEKGRCFVSVYLD